MISHAVSLCEFENTIPPDNRYTVFICDDGTNAVAYSGYNAMYVPSDFLRGIDSSHFICCGMLLDGDVSYIGDYNDTNHITNRDSEFFTGNYNGTTHITKQYSEFFSGDNITSCFLNDKYLKYSLISSVTSIIVSLVLVILYMISLCNSRAENRVLKYMMYNSRSNTRIPISNNLSQI